MKNIKRALAIVMALAMLLGMMTVASAEETFKIAIMHTDASQGEEPARAFEQLKAKYPDIIVGAAFPTGEQEAMISTALSLVSDPEVKALLIFQEPVGSAAAVKTCREVRPDVLYLAGVVAEDPDVVDSVFDIIIDPAKLDLGDTIIRTASEMGAKTFVHYSFPRHMAMESLAQRREVMKAACEKYGVQFVDGTSPDPLSDAGVSGTQQFILEDIPKMVEKYGKDTAFFGTNTAMMDVMVRAVVASGAMLPSTCDPSPFQGFVSGLGIEIPEDKANNCPYAVEQIQAKLAELGMSGRLATWPLSSAQLYFYSIFEYAKAYCEGKITEKTDLVALNEIFKEQAEALSGRECTVHVTNWTVGEKVYEHLLGFQMDFLVL